jgi:hypothetical protein
LADGIQQSAPGATITVQNDALSADGTGYDLDEIAAAFPADFIDLGVSPPVYKALVSVQSGDGIGTTKTTIRDFNESVVRFASGKTFLSNLTGRDTRWWIFGSKITGASGEDMGVKGSVISAGTNLILSGNVKVYGSKLSAPSCIILPGFASNDSEVLDSQLHATSGLGCGGTTGGVAKIRRLTMYSSGSGGAARVVQFQSDDADVITIAAPGGQYKVNTGGLVRMRRATFVGPSSVADFRVTQPGAVLGTVWSRECDPYVNPWDFDIVQEFGVVVTDDDDGSPIAGCLVELVDVFGRTVVSATTDSDGQITGFPMASAPEWSDQVWFPTDAVRVYVGDGVTGLVEQGPFEMTVNGDGAISAKETITRKIRFPRETFTVGLNEFYEFGPVYQSVALKAPSAPPAPGPLPTDPGTIYGEADILEMIDDFGVEISIAGVLTKAIVDEETKIIEDGGGFLRAAGLERTAIFKTGTLSPEVGIAVDVGGASYVVRKVERYGDGGLTRLYLAED